MDIPFLCVFFAFLLNYISELPVIVARFQAEHGYNNNYPRVQEVELTGWGLRAVGAHLNSFEAFAPFAAAVIIAHLMHVDMARLAHLCMAFILLRVLYIIVYLAKLSSLRSFIWFLGMICIGWIFCMAIF
jgi:uncharacterized MAPEG superfamily protein